MGWGADKNAPPSSEIFFEFTQLGGQMRVAAIDSKSGTEVIIIAPLSATQHQMQALAAAKLKRRLGQGT